MRLWGSESLPEIIVPLERVGIPGTDGRFEIFLAFHHHFLLELNIARFWKLSEVER